MIPENYDSIVFGSQPSTQEPSRATPKLRRTFGNTTEKPDLNYVFLQHKLSFKSQLTY